MADDLPVNRSWVIDGRELTERFSRASGPGGQGVNTTDSRVELVWNAAGSTSVPEHLRERVLTRLESRLRGGVLTVVAAEHRAQLANRQAARDRMAALLREAVAPPPRTRRPTRPTRGSKERRLTTKKRRSELKQSRRSRFDRGD